MTKLKVLVVTVAMLVVMVASAAPAMTLDSSGNCYVIYKVDVPTGDGTPTGYTWHLHYCDGGAWWWSKTYYALY